MNAKFSALSLEHSQNPKSLGGDGAARAPLKLKNNEFMEAFALLFSRKIKFLLGMKTHPGVFSILVSYVFMKNWVFDDLLMARPLPSNQPVSKAFINKEMKMQYHFAAFVRIVHVIFIIHTSKGFVSHIAIMAFRYYFSEQIFHKKPKANPRINKFLLIKVIGGHHKYCRFIVSSSTGPPKLTLREVMIINKIDRLNSRYVTRALRHMLVLKRFAFIKFLWEETHSDSQLNMMEL